ncbi:FHA domain-containing protein [Psidium guajava]|nr:FHA domain-containing protein [Psidium guajava]
MSSQKPASMSFLLAILSSSTPFTKPISIVLKSFLLFLEMELTSQSLSHARLLPKPLVTCCTSSLSASAPVFPSRVSVPAYTSLLLNCSTSYSKQLRGAANIRDKHQERILGPVHASSDAGRPSSADVAAERWLLQPVGDGDSRHIGFKVEMPGAFEIASSVVTVGRLPEKADMVIPVATVSSLHARIQKKEGSLLVTDLDSTNGTFIDDRKLRPGVAANVSPGSSITFGDTHLAMFRVSKLQTVDASTEAEELAEKPEPENSEASSESAA